MPRKFDVRLLPSGCKGCGICVHFCPAGVLEMSEEFTPRGYHPPRMKPDTKCTGCRTCELMCPDFAIFIEQAAGAEPEAKSPTTASPKTKRFPARISDVKRSKGGNRRGHK